MKNFLTIIFLLAGLYSNSGERKCSLIIKVDGLKKVQGNIAAMIFNQADGFPDKEENALASQVIEVKDASPLLIFSNLTPGKYAVSLIHDVNGNSDLDKNFIGIPTEPFGFSGNKSIFKGLPKFEDAAIDLHSNLIERRIKLVEIF